MTTNTPEVSKPRRALVWWGAALMVVGVLAAIAGGGLFIRAAGGTLIEAFTSPVRATPTDVVLDLDEGTYVVYEATGHSQGNGNVNGSTSSSVTISPADVTVVSPSGAQLPMSVPRLDETLDRGNLAFTGAVRFTVTDAGSHRVQVAGSGQQIIIAPALLSSFGEALPWLGLVAVGALLAFVGLILLIVGLVRGKRSPPAAATVGATTAPGVLPESTPTLPLPEPVAPVVQTPPTTPAGWYTDPHGVARLRWWDGQQWSEHTAP